MSQGYSKAQLEILIRLNTLLPDPISPKLEDIRDPRCCNRCLSNPHLMAEDRTGATHLLICQLMVMKMPTSYVIAKLLHMLLTS